MRTGEGIEELRTWIDHKKSILTGPSGSGKSSLMNQLQPGLNLRTGDVNEKTGRGRHTTTTSLLVPVSSGYLVDSPGVREFGLYGIELEQFPESFVEFRPFLNQCYFRDCTHRAEPLCAVKEAVKNEEWKWWRIIARPVALVFIPIDIHLGHTVLLYLVGLLSVLFILVDLYRLFYRKEMKAIFKLRERQQFSSMTSFLVAVFLIYLLFGQKA